MMNCLRTGKIAYRDTKEDCELFIEKPTHFPTHRINDLTKIQYSTVIARPLLATKFCNYSESL